MGLHTIPWAGFDSFPQVSEAATASPLSKSSDYTWLAAKCRAGRGKAATGGEGKGKGLDDEEGYLERLAYFANAAIASILPASFKQLQVRWNRSLRLRPVTVS